MTRLLLLLFTNLSSTPFAQWNTLQPEKEKRENVTTKIPNINLFGGFWSVSGLYTEKKGERHGLRYLFPAGGGRKWKHLSRKAGPIFRLTCTTEWGNSELRRRRPATGVGIWEKRRIWRRRPRAELRCSTALKTRNWWVIKTARELGLTGS